MADNQNSINNGLKEVEELIEKAKNLVKDGSVDEAQAYITTYLKDLSGHAEEIIAKVQESTPELVESLDGIFNKNKEETTSSEQPTIEDVPTLEDTPTKE